jgi:exonuclease V gamma subunit
VADRFEEARAVVAKAASLAHPLRGKRRVLSCTVEGVRVEAVATDVRTDDAGRDALVLLTASSEPGDEDLLRGLLTLIVARRSGDPLGQGLAHAVGHEDTVSLALPAAVDASGLLGSFIAAWREVRSSPVWLFPRVSRAVAGKLARGADERTAVEDAQPLWEGRPGHPGVCDDDWVGPLFGHLGFEELCDESERIAAMARRVWLPVFAGEAAAKAERSPATPSEEAHTGGSDR